jgi:hypothetical protein
MKTTRCTTTLAFALTLLAAACGPLDDSDKRNNEQKTCPPTGIVCSDQCPASKTLPNGAPCKPGVFDEKTCDCVASAPPTCEASGGQCGALTANGVHCPDGFQSDGDAGSCGLGGGCCMPLPSPPTCSAAGGVCGALTDAGVSCPDGYRLDAKAGSCGLGGGCCMPITCGGFAGIQCPEGFECVDDPNDNCDPQNGGADCGGICKKKEQPSPIPTDSCAAAGGVCGSITSSGILCPSGTVSAAHVGECGIGGTCCVATCGGFAGTACSGGLTCKDDPSDDCDPSKGGADCMGICLR